MFYNTPCVASTPMMGLAHENLIAHSFLKKVFVMTLTLGSQSKQGYGKVQAENAIWESHSHSWERCERV